MKVCIVSLFPELFHSFFQSSLIGKAVERELVSYSLMQLRDYSSAPHFNVDDTPYGGGPGMVMRPEPLAKAIAAAKASLPNGRVVFPSPSGKLFSQERAQSLSTEPELIFLCGRYEGIDQRIIDMYVDEEVSIGDYVVMGGEIPSMVILEAAIRLIPGVVGNPDSVSEESFSSMYNGGLEAPQYTKPATFMERSVPDILLSGDHQRISQWRKEQGAVRTKKR